MITIIPDGVYFIFPDGGSWIAVKIRNGRFVGRTEESMSATHNAAGDKWAGIDPYNRETDIHVSAEVADAVLALADMAGHDAVVERLRESA